MDLIVIDPRRTPTAEVAKLHVPVAPGGDIALLNAVGRLLLERDAVDRRFVADHTEGFEAYRDFLLQADWRRWSRRRAFRRRWSGRWPTDRRGPPVAELLLPWG